MEESIGEGGGAAVAEMNSHEILVPAEGLKRSEIYHVVKEVIGFVLYIHQQIPETLQHLEEEFDRIRKKLRLWYEESAPAPESEACSTRMRKHRLREVKLGIRRREKLMASISIPIVHGLMLALGGTLVRPQYVYDIVFSHEKIDSGSSGDGSRSKVANYISRKAIRSLISKGAGGSSYSGPMKLFLLVKAPATLKLPTHFLPKRDFKYHKKTVSFRLQIRCKTQKQAFDCLHYSDREDVSAHLLDTTSSDLIWFQCRQTIKG
ncbi:unnamed protein product [Spirodela intermedia]|uniref:Uncharacterized protein n=1 Tax=Spirodela intermedia TaxID=51605 RepID=A0A7I8I9K1_SPIIN|nr:unnamed protein product [Spirodela intermedia]CAA6654198.1 unnamed protein product [Spirodela intermedia]